MRTIALHILLLGLLTTGCTKSAFLDERPRSSLVIPSTLADMQAILDNEQVFLPTPVLGELSADNYYLTTITWQGLNLVKERNAYTWQKDIYEGIGNVFDWNAPYQQILYANLVLDGLTRIVITRETEAAWNQLKGSAKFLRAYAYYQLSQLFMPTYDSTSAGTDLGLPLKTGTNINDIVQRASVQATYNLILADLQEACKLLSPNFAGALRNRPTRPAAHAQMARVLLSMRAYTQAQLYADSSLQLYNTLIDYNTVSATASLPFTSLNNETLYQSAMAYLYTNNVLKGLTATNTLVDTLLFNSYHANDLRRSVYFLRNAAGSMILRPGYFANIYPFSGLATDEVYLIRAECAARLGNTTSALQDLNKLLQQRFRTGTFTPLQTTSAAVALGWVLAERRKELCFRGLRWSDLRRLNKEGANITLTRWINGTTYTLTPNSPLYTLPIPPDEIGLSGIQQNNR